MLVDPGADVLEVADDQGVAVVVGDVVVEDFRAGGGDVAGGAVGGAALAGFAGEAAGERVAVGVVDAQAEVVVVDESGPVLGREPVGPGGAVLSEPVFDASQFAAGERAVAA